MVNFPWVTARRASLALLALGLLVGPSSGAEASTSLYPDLRAMPPGVPHLDRVVVDGVPRRVLRFTAAIANAGPGALELRGEPVGDRTIVYQRVHDDAGGLTEHGVGDFVYHPAHAHWHFERFAAYQLWTRAEHERWVASGGAEGVPRWQGSKTTGQGESFCVRDSLRLPDTADAPPAAAYVDCGREFQGISVNWADVYAYFLPEQWIDLGDARPADGEYVLQVIADPSNLLRESPDGADPEREGAIANAASVLLRIQRQQMHVVQP
jgi:hypothetical protein